MNRVSMLQKQLLEYQNQLSTEKEKRDAGDIFAYEYGFYKGNFDFGLVFIDPRQLELFELEPTEDSVLFDYGL